MPRPSRSYRPSRFRVSVRLSSDEHEELELAAGELDMHKSELIREAVATMLGDFRERQIFVQRLGPDFVRRNSTTG